jgi:hypothetical protein
MMLADSMRFSALIKEGVAVILDENQRKSYGAGRSAT